MATNPKQSTPQAARRAVPRDAQGRLLRREADPEARCRRWRRTATSPELKKAFETHKAETEGQVERLGEVFELIGKRPAARPATPFSASSTRARP
jgi:hypothetical protein